jgi:two-component system LytT family response regulator
VNVPSTLVADEPDFDVFGECAGAASATAAIRATCPQVLFLDVQMPGLGGFDVVAALHALGDAAPAVVFVTAHEQFALQAFDAQAVDDPLKPFRRDRFAASLARVRLHLRALVGAPGQSLWPAGGGEYMATLRNGRELPVGPSYPAAIRAALGAAVVPTFGGRGGV